MLSSGLAKRSVSEIAFYGGTFTLLPETDQFNYLHIAEQFIHSGQAGGIRVSTRPDALAPKVLESLNKSGVRTVEIGCQSFFNAVLARSNRGHTAEENVAAVLRCQNFGFNVGVQLMPGLPGDTPETALSSVEQALALKPAFIRIYPALVIKGTFLADLWESGVYCPWPLEEAIELCADIYSLCQKENVPIVRMGLQQDLSLQKNLLAGPYHPAFGQLVRSRVWRRALQRINPRVTQLTIHPHDLSELLGHRSENRLWFENFRTSLTIKKEPSVPRGSLRISERDYDVGDLSFPGETIG
jgi:histone acetyltransferase (RNA polymerase elongator complex component)